MTERQLPARLSRRNMFSSFAHLPQALGNRLDDQSPGQADDELLALYRIALTACWQGSRGPDLRSVEQALPSYLWGLEQIAHASPAHLPQAAHLLAQGYTLRGILTFHRNHLQARADLCRQAVTWARQADDPTLLVATLATYGSTFHYSGQPQLALQTYQEALPVLKQASPLAQSSLLMKLAEASAQLGQERDARHSLFETYRVFPAHPWEDEAALFADCGEPSLCLWDSLTSLALSQSLTGDERTAHMYHNKAWNALDLCRGPQPLAMISQRNHVEIQILQARIAVALNDLDLFTTCLPPAVMAMKALDSEQRRREAGSVYWLAREYWPHEERVSDLAELFL